MSPRASKNRDSVGFYVALKYFFADLAQTYYTEKDNFRWFKLRLFCAITE